MVGGYILAIKVPLNIYQLPAVIPGAFDVCARAVKSKKLILVSMAEAVFALTLFDYNETTYRFFGPVPTHYIKVAKDNTVSLEAIE